MATVYRGVGQQVAKIVGQGTALDSAAHVVRSRILVLAAAHTETGRFASSITQPKKVRGKGGVTDRLISATDPNALSIEYGHGTRPSKKHAGSVEFVPGLHIMRRAAR